MPDDPNRANDEAERFTLTTQEECIAMGEAIMDVDVVTDENIQTVPSDTKQQNKKNGFDRGLQPDRIVTVSQMDGNLMFQVAWKNSNESESDLIEASVVYRKCPLLALEFFKTAFESTVKDETLLNITNDTNE